MIRYLRLLIEIDRQQISTENRMWPRSSRSLQFIEILLALRDFELGEIGPKCLGPISTHPSTPCSFQRSRQLKVRLTLKGQRNALATQRRGSAILQASLSRASRCLLVALCVVGYLREATPAVEFDLLLSLCDSLRI